VNESGRSAGPYPATGITGVTRQMEVAFMANENENVYEVPTLIEVGDFAELTQLTSRGYWIDSPWGAWWL